MPRGDIHEGSTVSGQERNDTISGTAPISLRMPASLKTEVEKIAKAEERSAASVIRHAVRVYIDKRDERAVA